jgi:hypothetical protein
MAQQGQAIFHRRGAKEKRAALAAERKRYADSFSYEDDQKKAALGKPAPALPAAAASAAAAKQNEDRRDKRR